MWQKGLEQGGEGSSAVAEGEFGLDVELGHGLVLLGKIEEGIVAEASGATGTGEDLALDCAVADGEDFSVACGSKDAVIAG